MPIVIKEAISTAEIEDVLQARYNILDESGRTIPNVFSRSRRISDHFDVYPTTVNIIVYQDGTAQATARAVSFGPHIEYNQGYDYRESARNVKGSCYLLDLLGIKKALAGHDLLLLQMIKSLLNILAAKQVDYAFFSAPTEILQKHGALLNLEAIGQPIQCPVYRLPITPCIINIGQFYDKTTHDFADREILRFQESFYHILFAPGEILITEGEKGTTAFLIEVGEVEVLIRQNDQIIPIHHFGKGNLIGEIGLITNEPRTASIMAKTPCACIAFDRSKFMGLMTAHPNRMLDMFKIFSKRLNNANQEISRLKKGP